MDPHRNLLFDLQNKIVEKVFVYLLSQESFYEKNLAKKSIGTDSPFRLIKTHFRNNFLENFRYLCKEEIISEEEINELLKVTDSNNSHDRLRINLSDTLSIGFEETLCLVSISRTLEFQHKKKVDILKVISQGAKLKQSDFRKKTGLTPMMARGTSWPNEIVFPFLSESRCDLKTKETFIFCPASVNKKLQNFKYLIQIAQKYWNDYFEERFLQGRNSNFSEQEIQRYYSQKAILDFNINITIRNNEYILK